MNIPVNVIPYTNGKLGKSLLVVYDQTVSGVALSGTTFEIDITQQMQNMGMDVIQSIECTANTSGLGLFLGDRDIPQRRYCKNSVQTILPLQSRGRMGIYLNGGTATNITFAVNDFVLPPVLVPIA